MAARLSLVLTDRHFIDSATVLSVLVTAVDRTRGDFFAATFFTVSSSSGLSSLASLPFFC